MMKKIVFVRRKRGLSKEEFGDHWLKEHADFFRSLPGVKRYVINIVTQPLEPGGIPYDGIAELWYENEEDFRMTENSSEFKRFLDKDNPKFQSVPDRRSAIVNEYIVK